MNSFSSIASIASLFASTTLLAQANIEVLLPSDSLANAIAEKEEKSFSFTGYIDSYFQNVFSDAKGQEDVPGTPLAFPTSFTEETRGFGIGNINLLAEKNLKKVGFVGQVGFGPRASAANGDFPAVQQLYMTYSPVKALTLTLGQFGTFVGYEVIDATSNMNYSTSYLFSYGPFFHTGAKADFVLGDHFGAMVGIFDNTDSRFNDPGYYYGAQLSAQTNKLSTYLNFLSGKDSKSILDNNDASTLQLDLTATYEFNDKFMLGINASSKQTFVGDTEGDGFTGLALYATTPLTPVANLNFRSEYFRVANLESVDGRSVFAFTTSGNINISDLRIIPEIRFDSSSAFATKYDGGIIDFGGGDDDDKLVSFILGAVYSF